jgi:hypothetical protein
MWIDAFPVRYKKLLDAVSIMFVLGWVSVPTGLYAKEPLGIYLFASLILSIMWFVVRVLLGTLWED